MHKVRENNNGSFSVGKTWVLDDLSAIQSYTNLVPSNPEEQQAKERAGGNGFIVTIQKPYYWQASTSKEKDFFIFSLIKIYKKYTAGKLPQLLGFEPSELEQLGGSPAPPTRPTPGVSNAPRTPGIGITNGTPSPDPSALGRERALLTPQLDQVLDPGRGPWQRPSQERPVAPNGDLHSRPSQDQSNRSGSETRSRPSQENSSRNESETRSRPSQERVLRSTDSDDRMPYVPGQFPASDFVRSLRPQASQTQVKGQRSDSPSGSSAYSGGLIQAQSNLRKTAGAQNTESLRNASETQSGRSASSQRPSEERARQPGPFPVAGRSESSEFQRPSTSDNVRSPSKVPNGVARGAIAQDQDPQTKRPPISNPTVNQNQKGLRSEPSRPNVPPILSPGFGRNNRQESSQSSRSDGKAHVDAEELRSEKQIQTPYLNGNRIDGSKEESRYPQTESSMPSTVNDKEPPNDSVAAPDAPIPTSEPPIENGVHRPGLGPMIKTKKSNKEIAATFRKAATTYNAFKPRAGGAAEKFQNAKEGFGNEPDGITGVVPAPSLLRGASHDQVKSPALEKAPGEPPITPMNIDQIQQAQTPEPSQPVSQFISPKKYQETPKMRISTPPSPGKLQSPAEAPQEDLMEAPPVTPEKDERRKNRKSDHSNKYAKALGIHSNLLEGRTSEIESVLNDFGWGEENTDRNTFEELQSAIVKELARVEAGSWLGAIENNDERIAAVGEMMDRVIAECDEFDCLLTLYNVELGVSYSCTINKTKFADGW